MQSCQPPLASSRRFPSSLPNWGGFEIGRRRVSFFARSLFAPPSWSYLRAICGGRINRNLSVCVNPGSTVQCVSNLSV